MSAEMEIEEIALPAQAKVKAGPLTDESGADQPIFRLTRLVLNHS